MTAISVRSGVLALVLAVFAITITGAFADRAARAGELLPLHGLTEDGLHAQPWLKQTFLDIADDAETADGEGKILVYIWEQKGCGSCKKLHEVNFRQPEIVDYLLSGFFPVQMNMIGSREVTTPDGTVLSEADFRAKSAIAMRPTLQFYIPGESADASPQEVFRISGYLDPEKFMNLLVYVKNGYYRKTPNFIDWYNRGEGLVGFTPAS